MQTTRFRNHLHLHRLQNLKVSFAALKSRFTLLAALVFGLQFAILHPLSSQVGGRGNYNYLDFQKKNYYFGITLAYNKSDYQIVRSKNFLPSNNDSISGLESIQGPGFNLQIISNLKIGENFDIRFLPGFFSRDSQLFEHFDHRISCRKVRFQLLPRMLDSEARHHGQ